MNVEHFEVKPVLRQKFIYFVIIMTLAYGVSGLLGKIPANGIYVFQIWNVKNLWLRSHLIPLLRYKITYQLMASFVYSALLVLLAWSSYLILRVKTTTYYFTNKYFEVRQGILSQDRDSTDMVNVEDQELHRSLLDRLLGIATVKIWSKRDKTDPYTEMSGLSLDEAERILEHTRLCSVRNYTDYRLAQDYQKQKGRMTQTDADVDPDSVDPDTKNSRGRDKT